MKKIIAFAGSNSKHSINKTLAEYTSNLISGVEVSVLDLNDFPLPIFGVDYEHEYGIPENAHYFLNEIKTSDGIIVSLAEHNGAYTTAFKNVFDWMSRIDGKLWNNKPMLLMAAAPGGRGGKSVLEIAEGKFSRMTAHIIGVFSLPFFHQNFADGKINDPKLTDQLNELIEKFNKAI